MGGRFASCVKNGKEKAREGGECGVGRKGLSGDPAGVGRTAAACVRAWGHAEDWEALKRLCKSCTWCSQKLS